MSPRSVVVSRDLDRHPVSDFARRKWRKRGAPWLSVWTRGRDVRCLVYAGGWVSSVRYPGSGRRGPRAGAAGGALTAFSLPGPSGLWDSCAGLPEACIHRQVTGLRPSPQPRARKKTTLTAPFCFPPAMPTRPAGQWSIPWEGSGSGPGGKCCPSVCPSWFWSFGASIGKRAARTVGWNRCWKKRCWRTVIVMRSLHLRLPRGRELKGYPREHVARDQAAILRSWHYVWQFLSWLCSSPHWMIWIVHLAMPTRGEMSADPNPFLAWYLMPNEYVQRLFRFIEKVFGCSVCCWICDFVHYHVSKAILVTLVICLLSETE